MDLLIVEDRENEKVAGFLDALSKAGITFEVVENLEDANKAFDQHSLEISTIILDLTFPRDKDDTVGILDRTEDPNGIKFLNRNGFQMSMKNIHLILNSCWDNDERDKRLQRTKYYADHKNDLILDILDGKTPLSHLTPSYTKKLIDMLLEAREKHKLEMSVPKESHWDRRKMSLKDRYWSHNGD